MEMPLHPAFYNGRNYLFMLGVKLITVLKRTPEQFLEYMHFHYPETWSLLLVIGTYIISQWVLCCGILSMRNYWYICVELKTCQYLYSSSGFVLLITSGTVASLLTYDKFVFKWKLHCHCPKGMRSTTGQMGPLIARWNNKIDDVRRNCW